MRYTIILADAAKDYLRTATDCGWVHTASFFELEGSVANVYAVGSRKDIYR